MRYLVSLGLIALLSCATVAQDAPAGKDTAKPATDKKADKEESLDDLLKRIEAAHKQHKDFKGKFDQTKFLPLFGDKVKSAGKFAFKKPDQVRWEYTEPHKSILVVKGESGSNWSESTRKVESFKLADDRGLDAVVKQLFTWFKGEFTKLKDDYHVEVKARDPLTLSMKPKAAALKKYIAAIEVKFTAKEEQISSVKLLEPLQKGDTEAGYTLYEFKETKLDSDLDSDEFDIDK
jgi:outer membrane lipoprotein-sorting protein